MAEIISTVGIISVAVHATASWFFAQKRSGVSRNGDFFMTILTYSYLNITYIQLCVINANRITRVIISPSFAIDYMKIMTD